MNFFANRANKNKKKDNESNQLVPFFLSNWSASKFLRISTSPRPFCGFEEETFPQPERKTAATLRCIFSETLV